MTKGGVSTSTTTAMNGERRSTFCHPSGVLLLQQARLGPSTISYSYVDSVWWDCRPNPPPISLTEKNHDSTPRESNLAPAINSAKEDQRKTREE